MSTVLNTIFIKYESCKKKSNFVILLIVESIKINIKITLIVH